MRFVEESFVLDEKEREMSRILKLDVQKICRGAVREAIIERIAELVANERKRRRA
ncbi:hypothetical protein [Methanoculleus frigidifontis]|uniref:hypothetical protein n=1 Tax=Methanoculleus frigidifontis TaxID=2584085 RepID=UPI002658FC9E|nr:hypothetical protein [Methanoculleus sp. FWC-SCC1]